MPETATLHSLSSSRQKRQPPKAQQESPALEVSLEIPNQMSENARDLEQELNWFAQVLDTRFKLSFNQEPKYPYVFAVPIPDLSDSESVYARFVCHYQLSFAERTAVMLSLVPHIRPQLLDVFFTSEKKGQANNT